MNRALPAFMEQQAADCGLTNVPGIRDTPKPIFLSVVLPAYNEEAAIERVVLSHAEALQKLQDVITDWEIVCVDDASSDRTLLLLECLRSTIGRLRIIRHQKNQGIYRSFADGFAAAKGTHIYATAADAQWPATNLARMLHPIVAGADLVIGVRLNRRDVYGLRRRLVSSAFNLSSRLLFGVNTVDAGSIKLGARAVFRFDLISRSVFIEAERIVKAQRSGYRVDFAPVEFQARQSGKETGVKWSNLVSSIRDCLRCIGVYRLAPPHEFKPQPYSALPASDPGSQA